MIIIMHFLPLLTRIGSVAEWSKALVLGTSLSGGVGSNPTAVNFCLTKYYILFSFIYRHIEIVPTHSPDISGHTYQLWNSG